MAMEIFKLMGSVFVDTDKADKSLAKTDDNALKVGRNFDKVADAASKLGKMTVAGLTAAGAAIVGLGKQAVESYAEYEQLVGGAQLMFGDAYNYIADKAQNAYKTVQMSQNDYLQQVNGFATGLKTAMNGNEQAAAELADKIITAEADVVAATGNTQENVQNAFNGIMKSNYTMLDNLQIGITPTKEGFQQLIDKVNAWNKKNGEATKYTIDNVADCQAALVDYIDMVGMSGYAGNEAAETIQGSLAMTKGAWDNLMTALANPEGDIEGALSGVFDSLTALKDNVLPIATETLKSFYNVINDKFPALIPTVAGLAAAIGTLNAVIAVQKAVQVVAKAWEAYQKANEGATVAQWLLNAAMNANPIGIIIALIAGIVAAITALWFTNEDFRNKVLEIWGKIKDFFIGVWDEIKAVWEQVKPVFDTIGEFFKSVWDKIKSAWGEAASFFSDIWDGIKESVQPLIDAISGAFEEAWELIKLVWAVVQPYFEGLWESIKYIFSAVKSFFEGVFKSAWDIIQAIWSVAVSYFKTIWENIKLVFSVVKVFFSGMFSTAWEAIKAIWNAVVGYFTAIWNSIRLVFSVVKNVLTGNWRDAWNGIKGIVDTWKGYFSGVWNSIKNVFSSVGTWFRSTFQAAWNAVKGVFSNWGSFFSGLWNTIKNTFTKLGTNISNAISGSVRSGLNGVLSKIEGTINTGINIINGAINLINKIPGVSVGKVGRLSLPRLEKGGVLEKGQVGLLEGNGAEAVVPLHNNRKWISAVAEDMDNAGLGGGGNDAVVAVLFDILAALEELLGVGIYLDTGALVGGLAKPLDKKLGQIAAQKARA